MSDVRSESSLYAAKEIVEAEGETTLPDVAPQPSTIRITESPVEVSAPAMPDPTPAKPAGYKLFSLDWAAAMREVINNRASYRAASTGWTAGALALMVEPAPRAGLTEPTAVLLDLHRGTCRSARSVTPAEALCAASFVIQGKYETWLDALDGYYPPLVMLTTGMLSLKKGMMLRLIPFTKSAAELVHCAHSVPLDE